MPKENKCSRFKKSKKQVEILQDHYAKQSVWNQGTIRDLMCITNLPKEKIYKWYWDQNKKFKQDEKKDDMDGIVIVSQEEIYSPTHQLYQCSGLQLNQEVSENLKNRLINLARDLILLKI